MTVKLKNLCCIVLFFITVNAFSLPPTAIKIPKNLGAIDYPSKSALTENIHQLFQTAELNNAYSLSLPLIASAQQGDKKIYRAVLEKIKIALKKMPNDYFKAWILGRILLAADSIGDETTLRMAQSQLKAIIAQPFEKATSDIDYAFYAWATGYLATLNIHEYKKMRPQLLETAQNLTTVYYKTKMPDSLSNAMWAWVLSLQAASYANDNTIYFYILNQIKLITGKNTIYESLQFALTRTDTSSDYLAWGMGMIELSAATIQDRLLYNELQGPLKQSLFEANQWGKQPNQSPENYWKATAEETLGELNQILSKVRHDFVYHKR